MISAASTRSYAAAPSRAPQTPARSSQPPSVHSDSVSLGEPSAARKAVAFVAATLGGSVAGLLGYTAGVLYAGTLVGPFVVGVSQADVGPQSLEEAVVRAQLPDGGALNDSASVLGSVGHEFLAPITWGLGSGKAGFQEIYGMIAGA